MNIEQLQPHQQQLVYNALLFFKCNIEEAFAECVTTAGHPTVNKYFFAYAEKEIKQIMQQLFGNTVIDEMLFVKHFNQNFTEIKSLLENRTTSPTTKEGVVQA